MCPFRPTKMLVAASDVAAVVVMVEHTCVDFLEYISYQLGHPDILVGYRSFYGGFPCRLSYLDLDILQATLKMISYHTLVVHLVRISWIQLVVVRISLNFASYDFQRYIS